MAVPDHVRDIVLVEMRRTFPEPTEKHDLQEMTGLGPSDLRAVVEELTAEGLLEDAGTGFKLTDKGYDPETAEDEPGGVIGQPVGKGVEPVEEDAEQPPASDEDDDLPSLEEELGVAPVHEPELAAAVERGEHTMDTQDAAYDRARLAELEAASETAGVPLAKEPTRYSTTLLIEVSYYPEPTDGENQDAAAVRESMDLAHAAKAGIDGRFPGLPVAAQVLSVRAYDHPRQVFGA